MIVEGEISVTEIASLFQHCGPKVESGALGCEKLRGAARHARVVVWWLRTASAARHDRSGEAGRWSGKRLTLNKLPKDQRVRAFGFSKFQER